MSRGTVRPTVGISASAIAPLRAVNVDTRVERLSLPHFVASDTRADNFRPSLRRIVFMLMCVQRRHLCRVVSIVIRIVSGFTQPRLHTQPRMPAATAIAEQAYTHTPLHTFSRPMPQLACTQSTVTSALPCQPTVPGELSFIDDTMQRVVERVDSNNLYSHSIEQLLADLPSPPHERRQPILPLSSVRTQTTASAYVNTDSTPSLSAQRYADTLCVNTLPHSTAPLSQSIALGQSNVTQPSALYAGSYTSDLLYSSGLVALNPNIARSSYADNSQRLPIAVEQPGFSAFSRVDVHHSRPAVADSTVQYAVCTSLPSATADNVRPTVTAHPALLQSPSIHWRKRLAYDYVQPDTGPGAPTHAAPPLSLVT